MSQFTIYTPETAPAGAADFLRDVEKAAGFIPNIHGMFAASVHALEGLFALNSAFAASAFSAAEREVISLTTSIFNSCRYCVAGHSVFGLQAGLSREEVEAIRADRELANNRLEALRGLTKAVLKDRGGIGEADLESFLAAGFRLDQYFDLLTGIAAKTMTNFASKTAQTPLDEPFVAEAWAPVTQTKPILEDV
jgi:uncharacterized peroxidase-related enzyme